MRSYARVTPWFFALIVALPALRAADNPPDAELAEQAKSANPDAAKLKDAYLKLQWARLMGTIPLQSLAPSTETIRSAASAALSDDEKAKLKAWLERDTKFRERLLLALNPKDDDYPNAARVLLTLREKFQNKFSEFENLALAFATVWDDPQVIGTMHTWHIPELYESKTPVKTSTMEEAFGWYTSHSERLCPGFKAIPWRLLAFVAADAMTLQERQWALTKYPVFRNTMGTVYSEVEYDYAKLKDMHGGKLGQRDYTLENLKQYGGVCRDQAYFARAVCSAFGMPAYYAVGKGNAAIRHAWVGWIIQEAGVYKLQSHGRYEYDKYFTAQIIDPRSGCMVFDYLIGIEARALSDEKGYDAADLLYRVWEECPQLPAQSRNNLLISALRKSAYHRAAWLAIGDATAAGELPASSAQAQWEYLNKNFREFPDFTFSMLSTFSKMFKTPAERYSFYEMAAKVFVNLKRQDLVASLRIEEIDMCVGENRKDLAAQVAASGTQECAGEGEQGAALAKRAADLLTEMKQPQLAIKPLQMALTKMPKTRAKYINPHWYAVSEVLRDLYKASGDEKNAAAVQADMDKVVKNLEKEREKDK